MSPYRLIPAAGSAIAFEPDGKIVVVNAYINPGPVYIVRFYPDGALDTSFGTNGEVELPSFTVNGHTDTLNNGNVQVATLPDGRILVAGGISDTTVPSYNAVGYGLVMYLPDGQLDTSFNGTGTFGGDRCVR